MGTATKLLIPTQVSIDDVTKLLTQALGRKTKVENTSLPNREDDYESGFLSFAYNDENGEMHQRRMHVFTIFNPSEFSSDGKEFCDGKRTILSLGDNDQGVEIMKKIHDAAGGFLWEHDYNDNPDSIKSLTDFFDPEKITNSVLENFNREINNALNKACEICGIPEQDGDNIKGMYESFTYDEISEKLAELIAGRTQKQEVSKDKGSPSP